MSVFLGSFEKEEDIIDHLDQTAARQRRLSIAGGSGYRPDQSLRNHLVVKLELGQEINLHLESKSCIIEPKSFI